MPLSGTRDFGALHAEVALTFPWIVPGLDCEAGQPRTALSREPGERGELPLWRAAVR